MTLLDISLNLFYLLIHNLFFVYFNKWPIFVA